MNMNREDYKQYAKAHAPKSPIVKNCVKAFLFGGAICALSQGIRELYMWIWGFAETDASALASATIAAQILSKMEFGLPQLITLGMSALCAGLTVGGKAIGKTVAVNSATEIVHMVGRLIHWFNNLPVPFRKKKKNRR